ncbi:hypothetical protein PIN31009_00336 [Pandoraea iniqua]|uniref:hypothetical protein n=1 Tax=Pandoraea iniqua TaxID=2508288 RepID=UPI001250ED53|nr:hypothetical protein [Pandoraea iniqua]VVD65633.1 hypothetical protein PIN31009_00336 [Pandoraea iniqua]
MPAIQPYLSPHVSPHAASPALPNVSDSSFAPPMQAEAAAPRRAVFATNFEVAANRADHASEGTSAAASPHTRRTRSSFPAPCNTRYPSAGGFTRQSLSTPQQIAPQNHTQFLRANAESAVFGELLEMLRPVDRCPNRNYIWSVELRDELMHRMYCLGIFADTSVGDMAVKHKIPSLMVDGPGYFPGTVAAVFYDIGFEALRLEGVPLRTLDETPASRIEGAGRFAVRAILRGWMNPRDPYHGFTPYFKPLQFHAHANGMHDAADMLDRITRDDSFGSPVTGPSDAASFLADEASLLDAHLRQCERAAEPSAWEKFFAAYVKPVIKAHWFPRF